MDEVKKTILLCFKDYDDLFRYRRETMRRLERYCDGFKNGNTMYKLGLMNSSTVCGLSVDEVFFVNCSIDDCEDEDFKLTLRVLEKWRTKVHYDPKDTEKFQEELQAKIDRIDFFMKLHEFFEELRQYKHEVAMKKLNEEFALKQHENEMEVYKEILEKYENGTLWKELE